MIKKIFLVVCTLASLNIIAQQKLIDYNAAFKSSNIYVPLPNVVKWIDDNNVVLAERSSTANKNIQYVLNVSTGIKTPIKDSLQAVKLQEKLIDGAVMLQHRPIMLWLLLQQKIICM
jgi:hypothetical protein